MCSSVPPPFGYATEGEYIGENKATFTNGIDNTEYPSSNSDKSTHTTRHVGLDHMIIT